MAERSATVAVVVAGLLSCAVARAEKADTSALDEERDRLLDKIVAGTDYEANVKRFAELIGKRDLIVATSQRARDAERDAQKQQRDWLETYRKTADYEVSWRCTLSPDPGHPLPSREGRFKPDWGKVLRRQKVRLQPKNELDEGEQVTLYEVQGVAKRYVFRGEHFDPFRKPFEAEVGDLVLVCDGGEDLDRKLPADWGERSVRSGFAVRLQKPPLIVDKARFQPIHITGSAFFWAIREVKWAWAGQHVLSNVEVGRSLGEGRYEMPVEQGLSWVLEVPPGTKNASALVPGHHLWLILGDHRFDKALRKLVLVAKDVEPTYIFEKSRRF
jgi:hypothetical protein